MEFFCHVSGLKAGMSVLDVGGMPWAAFFADRTDLRVTFLNLYPPERVKPRLAPGHVYIQGDARSIPVRDRAFEIVFSNSLLEHLDRAGQEAAAEEIRRVGRFHFVEVPYRFFPWEPHYNLPLVQFAPEPAQRVIWRSWWLSLGRRRALPFERIYLFSRPDLRRLFPASTITEERVGPLIKALYAWGRSDA
jgi:hypothetical protein